MLLNPMLRYCYYALYCKMRAQRPQAYARSCTFLLCYELITLPVLSFPKLCEFQFCYDREEL